MHAAEHAPRGPFRLLECRYGLAEIVERSTAVAVERLRVYRLQPKRTATTRDGLTLL